MATRSAKLYQGEDMTPVLDYTDWVVWEESEFGTRAWQGEGSASTVVIRDALGETGNSANLPSGLQWRSLASKNLFVIDLDGDILFRGRVGIKNYSRGNQQVERYRQVEVSLHDTHWDLDHIFVNGYSRPEETGNARIQGIIASYLSGSPRETTQLNGSNYLSGSNTITLEAQTFERTTPLAMIRDTATAENKQFFITGDTLGGGSIFYDGNDSTIYASDLRISDRPSDASSVTFPPIWNVGPASTEDGSQQLCEVVLFYGSAADQYVTAHNLTVHTQYGHASETFTDDTIVSATAAQRRANAILAHRQYEDKTYNVTIGPLSDTDVLKVKHGQTINIKARAITDADDQFRLMRIVQCRYTTPVVGVWFAHLQLGRPWKIEPYGTGAPTQPKPASPGTPESLTTYEHWRWGEQNDPDSAQEETIAHPHTGAIGQDAEAFGFAGQAPECRVPGSPSYSLTYACHKQVNTGSSSGYIIATAGTVYDFTVVHGPYSPTYRLLVRWYSYSAGTFTALRTDTIFGTASPTTWQNTNQRLTAPTNTAAFQILKDDGAGAGVAVRFDEVLIRTVDAAAVPGTTNINPDLAGDNEGYYSNLNHTHTVLREVDPTVNDDTSEGFRVTDRWVNTVTGEEWVLTDATEGAAVWEALDSGTNHAHAADTVSITDAGGYFTGTDVEAALQELGAGGAGAGTVEGNTPISGSLSNPPTESELEVAIGEHPAAVAGQSFVVTDSDSERVYLVKSDGFRFGFVPLISTAAGTNNDVITLDGTNDAGWSDLASQQQSGWHYNDKTYWTALQADGDVIVSYWDHATATAGTPIVLHAALDTDQHLAPVLLIRSSDHKLIVYYSKHSEAQMRLRISTNSLDTDPTLSGGFAAESNIAASLGTSDHTYPQVHELTDGIYLFYRSDTGTGGNHADAMWSYSKSTDGVTGWAAATDLFTQPGRGSYWTAWKTASNRVDFLVADGAHGGDTSIDVCHMYYLSTTGLFYETNGAQITASLPYSNADLTRVFDSGVGKTTQVNSVSLGPDGNPLAAFRYWETYSGPEDMRYYYARWDGSAWSAAEVAANGSGAIWGNVTIDSAAGNVLYIGRQISGQTEMTRWVTLDNGATWTEDQLTSASAAVNTTPVPVINAHPSLRVLWMNGLYASGATPKGWGLADPAATEIELSRLVTLDGDALGDGYDETVFRRGSDGTWYASTDGGSTWEAIGGTASVIYVPLAVDDGSGGWMDVFTADGKHVMVSVEAP